MSLIDLFKGFHRTAIQQEFPPSARVLVDTFVYKLNEAFWPDSLVFSERDLMQLTGLKKTTLHEAKHFLTSRHVIECKPFKNKAAYSLGNELKQLLSQPTDQLTDHSPTTNRPFGDQSLSLNPKVTIQCKTEDLKTKETTLSDKRARANSKEFEDLLEYWDDQLHGGRLSFEHQSEILALVQRHGVEWVKAAMREASDANSSRFGISMKLFRAVVERKANPKPKIQPKGSVKIARSPNGGFKPPPAETGNEPWASF